MHPYPDPPLPRRPILELKPVSVPPKPEDIPKESVLPRSAPRPTHKKTAPSKTGPEALRELGGLYSMLRSEANGGRPVAICIPSKCDKTKPFHLILFFHGKGTHLDELLCVPELLEQIHNQGKNQPNTVFAFPQGHPRERYHLWMNASRSESLARLVQEIEKAGAALLEKSQITFEKITIKAHSSGGVVFKNAIDANELKANRLEFFDAMYGDWSNSVLEWALKPENASVDFGIVYSPHQQAQVRNFRKSLAGLRNMEIERARANHSLMPFHHWILKPYGLPSK